MRAKGRRAGQAAIFLVVLASSSSSSLLSRFHSCSKSCAVTGYQSGFDFVLLWRKKRRGKKRKEKKRKEKKEWSISRHIVDALSETCRSKDGEREKKKHRSQMCVWMDSRDPLPISLTLSCSQIIVVVYLDETRLTLSSSSSSSSSSDPIWQMAAAATTTPKRDAAVPCLMSTTASA